MNTTEFRKPTIQKLAERAGQTCSNPDCRKPTSGGHTDKNKSVLVGEAAHIYGQRVGGKRFSPNKTDEEIRDISNGIWLCSICHKLIDTDEQKYPVSLLLKWKSDHENTVLEGEQSQIKEMAKDIKEIKRALGILGFKQNIPLSSPDVLKDKNIKLAIEAWGKGNLKEAFNFSKEAYFNSTGYIKLQAIINMILLSGDEAVTNSGYFMSLSNEGIALANHLKDSSSAAVIKAHKAYFLQHKTFEMSLRLYGEVLTRQTIGYPTVSNSELMRLGEEIKVVAKEIDTLVYQSQKEAYDIKDWNALAHIKVTAANTIGLTYFLTRQMGVDTGQTEQQTVQLFLEAKYIYENLGDQEGIAITLHNLANNLRFFGDKQRAIRYAKEALQIANKIGYVELIGKAKELLENRLHE